MNASRLKPLVRLFCTLVAVAFLAGCGSKISQTNFDKIEKGMTRDQVIALLGEPSDSSSLSLGGLSGTSAEWTDGKATISIQFLNEKVTLKQFTKKAKQ